MVVDGVVWLVWVVLVDGVGWVVVEGDSLGVVGGVWRACGL